MTNGTNDTDPRQPALTVAAPQPLDGAEAAPQPLGGAEATPLPRRSGRPQVVIIGAGFGGLAAARTLGNTDVDVLVIDRNNYHGFWPLLYQVATAGIETESIAYPVRGILRRYRNADFLMAEVTGVDFERKLVLTDGPPVEYDYLIISAGSANNYFGNDALAEHTLGMKDIDDAERLRNNLLLAFEAAVHERDPARRAALLTFVIIGGGPTGVELAGAFAELIHHVLRKDYPMIDRHEPRVVLVEASNEILSTFPEKLRARALARLKKMGVDVRLGTRVDSVGEERVHFADGSFIETDTVVWAAGVRAAHLADTLGTAQARGARVKVTETLTLPGRDMVFVIGDMAYLEGYRPGVAYPMVAPVAIQMGRRAARNILADIRGRPREAFTYFDKGQMATIGRRAAVMDAFGLRWSGFFAWLGWLFVHLIELIGFRNRLIVLTNWAYNYFTWGGGVRLITWTDRRPEASPRLQKTP